MPNHYFKFKQFTIEQDLCAMKVCTDACLFGAWTIEYLHNNTIAQCPVILDIGTGTGLLSLMLAQEIKSKIDAVELDPPAVMQASKNIKAARFNNPIRLIETDIKKWKGSSLYDCIISNPPFFENQLSSSDAQKNRALHSSDLDLKSLIHYIHEHLKENGIAAILLPYYRKQEMIAIAKENKLFPIAIADIHQTDTHAAFRTFFIFSPQQKICISEKIIIKEKEEYTERFKQLLKNFYLAF